MIPVNDPLKKILSPIKELQNIRGVALPIGLEFLQLVITGPPGAGKSYYINQIGGWPNEGYIDLTHNNWWKNQSLVYRPREIHLGLPFAGMADGLTVFDKEYLDCQPRPELELSRIKIPPAGSGLFATNWRDRYIFEFLIPDPEVVFSQRQARQSQGYFPVDDNLSLEMVELQVAIYREVALYMHRAGIHVYIRKGLNQPPMRINEHNATNVPPWAVIARPTRPSLKTLAGWKWLVGLRPTAAWLTLTNEIRRLQGGTRIAHDGKAFDMLLGEFRLRFSPEITLGVSKKAVKKNWLIHLPEDRHATAMNGFARIRVGDTVDIGRANKELDEIFNFPKDVAKRHLTVTNRRGDLVLTPLDEIHGVRLVRRQNFDLRERLPAVRYNTLVKIKKLFGGAIAPLPPPRALELLRSVNTVLENEPYRIQDKDGRPGGLIELPASTPPVIVGDLHAQVDNLLKILSDNCLLDCLDTNAVRLIFLGDAVHSETAGEMENMDSSILMMDLILRLKLQYPANVFYLRGNHDSFDPHLSKGGISQGLLLRNRLQELRGGDYVQEMERFYELLPYVVVSDTYIACHAGPPRTAAGRDDIVNIRDNPELAHDLTTSRLQLANSLTSGYTKNDVKRFRAALGLGKGTRLIVGHTPLDPFGSFWKKAGAIKGHHILYSAHKEGPGVFIVINNKFVPLIYPAEPLTKIINRLRLPLAW